MGLFDSVAGAVLGKVLGGNQGGMAAIAMELFNQNGGIGGIMDKFKAGGLGDAASSWVSLGETCLFRRTKLPACLAMAQLQIWRQNSVLAQMY